MRLTDALARADAELASYIEREDAYTVTFAVDGRPHRSTVRKDDLITSSSELSEMSPQAFFRKREFVFTLPNSSNPCRLLISDNFIMVEMILLGF